MNDSVPSDDEILVIREKMSRRGCLWRLGCLAIWLPFILLPLLLFTLAVNGEFTLWHHAGFPQGDQHPFLQAKLLMDIDTRGLNITRSYVSSAAPDDRAVCVQTHVRFLLWQGESTPADYCDCYTRESDDGAWQFQSQSSGACD